MSLAWYPHNIGEYFRDTMSLSMLEHGAYRIMIDYYYANNGINFPGCQTKEESIERIYMICNAKTEDEKKAVNFVLSTFFKESANGFINKKCEKVMQEQKEKHERRVNAAKTRYKQKIEKNDINLNNAMHMQYTSNAIQNKKKNKNKNISIDIDAIDPPNGVEKDCWKNYLNVRESIGAKNTNIAISALKKKLDSMSSLGYDPNEIVIEATINEWKSVYQPKWKPTKNFSNTQKTEYKDGLL